MRRILSSFLWLLAVLLVGPASALETILDFHSEIQVLPDASLRVTETIRVRAEGQEIRRGIYRDFPTDYRDHRGNRYRVGFDLISVERDGTDRQNPITPPARATGSAFTSAIRTDCSPTANTPTALLTAPTGS